MSYLLAIDPGINALGGSVWYKKPKKDNLKPDHAFCIESNLNSLWFERCFELVYKLNNMFKISTFDNVVTEFPEFFHSAKGNAAAEQGDVCHMAHMCGLLQSYCGMYNLFTPILVTKWKGQLSKPTVKKRLKRVVGRKDGNNKVISEHAWDSTGVGLVWMGYKLDDSSIFGRKK